MDFIQQYFIKSKNKFIKIAHIFLLGIIYQIGEEREEINVLDGKNLTYFLLNLIYSLKYSTNNFI